MDIDPNVDRDESTTPVPTSKLADSTNSLTPTIPPTSPELCSGTVISASNTALVKNATVATKLDASVGFGSTNSSSDNASLSNSTSSSNQAPPMNNTQSNQSTQKSIKSFFSSKTQSENKNSVTSRVAKLSADSTPEPTSDTTTTDGTTGEKPKQVRRRRKQAVLEVELEPEDVPWAVSKEPTTESELDLKRELIRSGTKTESKIENEKVSTKESQVVDLSETESKSYSGSELLVNSPDIAMIVMFLSRFHHLFTTTPLLSPQDLQHHLSQDGLSSVLESLICRLVTYTLNRKKPVENGKYRRALEELTVLAPSLGGIEDQPTPVEIIPSNESELHSMSPQDKLLFLRALVYWTLGASDAFKLLLSEVKQLPGYEVKKEERMAYDHLVVFPLGSDADRNRYFFIEGGEFDITTTRGQKGIPKVPTVANATKTSISSTEMDTENNENNEENNEGSIEFETETVAGMGQKKPLHESYLFLLQDPSLSKLAFLTDFQLYRERNRLTDHPEWVRVAYDAASLTQFLIKHASTGDDSPPAIKLRQKIQRLLPLIEQAELKRQRALLATERKRALESAAQRAREGDGIYLGRTRRNKRVDYREANDPKQIQEVVGDDDDGADECEMKEDEDAEDDGEEDEEDDMGVRKKRKISNEDYVDEESMAKGTTSNSGRLRRSARVKYF
ncbi:hypothetical protein NADFUDRAFT_50273 [Nadsonia fulvescens var. elongata DSM 6958]|uniref:WHIM1 domain-containing protein n=1 Tax=Nadsonia fulvescens var. elongata DSM 6958 TaxID=857566 RepID=A0A1E3PNC3_9ASCO|nr:hypothetical protein NADFUDRAFT_50273 [Nadsonia fulvescens var. elongata DSM 6958]